MPGIDASVVRVTPELKYTPRVLSRFRQVACAFGSMTLGERGLLEDALVMARRLSNRCSRSVTFVDLRP